MKTENKSVFVSYGICDVFINLSMQQNIYGIHQSAQQLFCYFTWDFNAQEYFIQRAII